MRRLDLPFLRIVVTGSPEAQDLYCEWQRVREIEEAGALLVRPDGVVAWRDKEGASDVEDATARLSAAVCAVLDLPNFAAILREPEPVAPNGTLPICLTLAASGAPITVPDNLRLAKEFDAFVRPPKVSLSETGYGAVSELR